MVTLSPCAISPPSAVPVTAMVSPLSVALITSSAVMFATVTVPAVADVSNVTSRALEVAVLPAASVAITVMLLTPSLKSPVAAVKVQTPLTRPASPSLVSPLNTSTVSTSASTLLNVKVAVSSFVRLSVLLLPLSLSATRSTTGVLISKSALGASPVTSTDWLPAASERFALTLSPGSTSKLTPLSISS